MSGVEIRLATKADAEIIITMLTGLGDEIGDLDRFQSTKEAITNYGFGQNPMFQCFVAEQEKSETGLVLFFPVFSTTRGKPGVYVQDLWVSRSARGQGLGRRMLAEVINYSAAQWDASYLTLMMYADNAGAKAFYKNLGFTSDQNELPMALDGDAFVTAGADE